MRKVLKYILGVVLVAILLLSILFIHSDKEYELTKVEEISTDENYINVIYEENINVGSAMSGINAKEIENYIVDDQTRFHKNRICLKLKDINPKTKTMIVICDRKNKETTKSNG